MPAIPPIKTYRGPSLSHAASLIQDATKQFAQNAGQAIGQLTQNGTLAGGALVTVNFPANGTWVLVNHNLGHVANGAFVVNSYVGGLTVIHDPRDTQANYPAASQTPSNVQGIPSFQTSTGNNPNPTQNIRLMQSTSTPCAVQLWVF